MSDRTPRYAYRVIHNPTEKDVPENGSPIFHAEGEPAVVFKAKKPSGENYSFYFFQNIKLDEKYGKHVPENWNPKWILEERNAEIRALFLREIGNEQFFDYVKKKKMAKILNEQTLYNLPYQLWEIQTEVLGRMKWLFMQNPSEAHKQHIEPVAPDDWIKTCEDALQWRWGANGPSEQKKEAIWVA